MGTHAGPGGRLEIAIFLPAAEESTGRRGGRRRTTRKRHRRGPRPEQEVLVMNRHRRARARGEQTAILLNIIRLFISATVKPEPCTRGRAVTRRRRKCTAFRVSLLPGSTERTTTTRSALAADRERRSVRSQRPRHTSGTDLHLLGRPLARVCVEHASDSVHALLYCPGVSSGGERTGASRTVGIDGLRKDEQFVFEAEFNMLVGTKRIAQLS